MSKFKKKENTSPKFTKLHSFSDKFSKTVFFRIMFRKGLIYFLLSFFIPAGIMTFAFAQNGIHPFGDNQMLVVDLWHQYYPFFRVEREKLLSGGSFFYSWENGLGSNFLSLISYYAASPLNWISVFFSDGLVRDALTFILIAKIGFAGMFFNAFLRYTYRRNDFSTCIFSVMYALSSYTLGYYWNVMWFDTIALFPLVMLGIVALCREGKWKTYTFSLALSLIANYYVGFFTCIFTVFMFAATGIIEFKSIKKWLYSFWLIVRSSILAIAMGGFILLPAYFGLQLTYSANNDFPKDTVWYEKWEDIFANLISYNEPTKVEGLPNFACGMLAVLLFGVFLFSNGIKIREKVSSLTMLGIIAVSCNMNKLNFIWHGFHFTNQIPYRFAFIFCFILAAAAYRAFDIILKRGVRAYQLILMLMGPFAVFWLSYFPNKDDFSLSEAMKNSMIISGALWLIFLAAKVFPFRRPVIRNGFICIAVAAAVFSEFVANTKLGVKTVGKTAYTGYPTRADEVEPLLNHIKETDDDPFFRTEMTSTYTLNDSALYGYCGLSQFSSAANVSATTLCKRLGLYASEAGNRYYYRTSTPVVNSLFGIRYLISRGKELNSEDYYMEHEAENGLSNLYKSKYPLSLGYMMNDDILNLPDNGGINPFEFQNDIVKLATGISEPVFNAQPVALVDYNTLEVTKNGYGNYTFRRPVDGSNNGNAVYSFAGVDGSALYGYASSTGDAVDDMEITCYDDADASSYYEIDKGGLLDSYPLLFPMGNTHSGTTTKIKITPCADRSSGNFRLFVYALDIGLFEQAYKELADEQLQITHFEDTKIEGMLNAKKSGVLYLAMPYEKGWSVYIDGEKAETFKVLNAMTGVKVAAGSHRIKLQYVPEGFAEGVALSAVSIVLTGFIIWTETRRKKKKAAAAAEAPVEFSDEPPTDNAPVIGGEIYNQAEEVSDFKPDITENIVYEPDNGKSEDADEES